MCFRWQRSKDKISANSASRGIEEEEEEEGSEEDEYADMVCMDFEQSIMGKADSTNCSNLKMRALMCFYSEIWSL